MPTIEELEPKIAAGILARAALDLEAADVPNPSANPVFDWELELRAKLISEFRKNLGLTSDDFSHEARDRLAEELDQKSDELDRPDIDAAIQRLSSFGTLPSDQYDVQIIDKIRDHVYGPRFSAEYPRILETVRSPDFEQHFGPAQPAAREPFLISLFARFYQGTYPRRNFYLLIVGRRDGTRLEVHQVWRVYPAVVRFTPSNDLVGMLRAFTDAFGSDFIVKQTGEVGRMVVSLALPPNTRTLEIESLPTPKPFFHYITSFVQPDIEKPGSFRGSFVVSVNLSRYRELLETMHWEEEPLPRTRPSSRRDALEDRLLPRG